MERIKIEGLYDMAKRAYSGVSFDPEKRAENIVREYENIINDDIKDMPENERERYINGFKQHLFDWLTSKARIISPMITGPANFPVRSNNKALQSERNRSEEFIVWRNKALASITKKVEDAKPVEQKNTEALGRWKEQVDRLFEGWLVDRFKSRLETVARTGNVELVSSVLEYMKEQQTAYNRVLATPRNSLWILPQTAEKYRIKKEEAMTADNTEKDVNGVRVVHNNQIDRIQLFFDGKPDSDTISKLKGSGFHWSPSNKCWQRQLTNNAIWAAERILKNYEQRTKLTDITKTAMFYT